MKTKQIILIIVSILITLMTLIYMKGSKKKEIIFSCNYDTKLYFNEKNTSVVLKVFIKLYDDDTGFKSEHGEMIMGDKKYIINKDVFFTYSDHDKDKTYTIENLKTVRRKSDTTPINSYGDFNDIKTKYYMSFNKIGNDIYLIRERGNPLFICTKNKA
jgi:hypothetical protein